MLLFGEYKKHHKKKLLMGQSKWPITKKKALSFGMHPHLDVLTINMDRK
jgi:hypothetical protein